MLSASKIVTPNLSERKIDPALGLLNLAKLFYKFDHNILCVPIMFISIFIEEKLCPSQHLYELTSST